ncbi:MAG: acyl-CoA dehydrogenase family protein [bacterium]
MIDFELPPDLKMVREATHGIAKDVFRPVARKYDEQEHAKAEEIQFLGQMMSQSARSGRAKKKDKDPAAPAEPRAETENRVGQTMVAVVGTEEMAWGDLGLMIAMPGSGLGNHAIAAVATPEQFARFGDKFAAMAITEPGAGSDSGAITTTAVLDGDEWVINGEKIFVTDGRQCDIVVVWATVDRASGKAGIRSFIVEKDRPGVTVTKLEHKLGIRASDTASIVFDNVRIPRDNLLGASKGEKKPQGFKGVMKTFDNTRPMVASMALGCARAALEFTKSQLEEEGFRFRYGPGKHALGAVEREILVMEAELEAMRLLVWRAAWMGDNNRPNAMEASMSKAKAGRMGSQITQRCVALLGPLGYSREWLVEKWARDCKINDIFEGTQQIQQLVVARNLLGYSRKELK